MSVEDTFAGLYELKRQGHKRARRRYERQQRTQDALKAGIHISNNNVKIQYEKSPIYYMFTITENVKEGIAMINRSIQKIKEIIVSRGGSLEIDIKPTYCNIE